MNTYFNQFRKFSELTHQEYDSYSDLCRKVLEELSVESSSFPLGEAIVVLGFSGNGKTTWIRNYIKKHPFFELISMDNVQRNLMTKYPDGYDSMQIVEEFGKIIEEKCSRGASIIIDGFFLNLLTRCCLTQTLHSYQYSVGMVDLTDNITRTLPNRIMDYCGQDIGIQITPDNIFQYSSDPRFQNRYQEIVKYYQRERIFSHFDEQKELGILSLDFDFIVDKDNFEIFLNTIK